RRIESDRVQAVLWLAQRIEPRAGRDVPDLHGTVRGARYQSLAVGCESQCVNRVDVVLKRADLFSGIHVPELDQFVIARSGHAFSVRRKGNSVDAVVMTFDGALVLARIDIPDLHLAPPRGQTPGRRQIFSVA